MAETIVEANTDTLIEVSTEEAIITSEIGPQGPVSGVNRAFRFLANEEPVLYTDGGIRFANAGDYVSLPNVDTTKAGAEFTFYGYDSDTLGGFYNNDGSFIIWPNGSVNDYFTVPRRGVVTVQLGDDGFWRVALIRENVVYENANFTAQTGTSYNVNDTDAGITVTSPSGTEGDWFDVFVQGGSVNVGGADYTDGITIKAHYVGGGWEYNAIYPATGAFGTAAYRDVGQASGNVLELSAGGTATIGDSVSNIGTVILKAGSVSPDVSVKNDDGTLTFSQNGIDINLPSAAGVVALTADLSTLNASNLTSGTVAIARLPTITVATGGTGATTLTANNVILGNGTSAVQFVAPGTSGNVLTSNGTTWTSAAASSGVPTSRTISTTAPLTGGGDLSANRTLAISDATTSTQGTVPTLGATGSTVTGAPTRRQMLVATSNQFTYRVLGAWMTSAATSGTGTAVSSDSAGNMRLTGTTSAGARNQMPTGSFQAGVWNGNYTAIDWGLPFTASGLINIDHTGTAASDTRIRAGIGKSGTALGQISARGFMVEIQWNGTAFEVYCGVHNGTTLNLQTSGVTFAKPRGVLWSVEADGAGNARWYISAGGAGAPYNGQARTTVTLSQTGAPTGTETTTRYPFAEINNGAAGGAALTVDFQPMTVSFGI
jgi:hypothetical protein